MGKSVYIVLLFVVLAGMTACHEGGYKEMEAASMDPVILKINVSLPDLPKSRAGEESSAVSDHEKMQTLRVIVVNSNNDIEGNEFVDFVRNNKEEHTMSFRKVKSNDAKMIYLIANEKTTKKTTIGDVTTEKPLIDYDFNTLTPGSKKFPTEEILALKMKLDQNDDELSPEQLTGALPMSEWHRVRIPSITEYDGSGDGSDGEGFFLLDDNDKKLLPSLQPGEDEEIYGYRKTLWITRAAVKFTYRFKNDTDNPIKISGLGMDRMATLEYFMPRVTERDGHEIKQFVVPAELTNNSGYYTFKLKSIELPLTVTANGGETSLKPIYLLEGKYADATNENEKLNYKVSLTVNHTQGEVTLSDYLPNLSQLPRNTHVVVEVTFKGAEIKWNVVVHPYIGVNLEPEFGL